MHQQPRIIDEAAIDAQLAAPAPDAAQVNDILARARELKGLPAEDVAALTRVTDPAALEAIFAAAAHVKDTIYGPRVVLFAPLYIANVCANECSYCAFRTSNELSRRTLTRDEVVREVEALVTQGHKRLLVVAGEALNDRYFDGLLEAIDAAYSVKIGHGEIRRINVNVAPLDVPRFERLKAAGIGTYQLFQETYHLPTYQQVHRRGPKRDYAYRLETMARAMEAGIDDVGIGPLLGLYDWRFELLAMLQHIASLEARFGVGPHTISVPRLEPADGSTLSRLPPHAVSDDDFLKLIALLRLAVPYTGIILSTRETPEVRRRALALGVSQISAGSRTDVGGYTDGPHDPGQFQLGDHRSLDEVVADLAGMGYVPSFCTACYRLGRTGQDFMDLAKPGAIKNHCDPNAISTLVEYLCDHASPGTVQLGRRLVSERMGGMDEKRRKLTEKLVAKVDAGKRDVLV